MIIAALIVLGLCAGSFVNALVWRVHEQEHELHKKKPDQKYLRKLSIRKGRSICPNCHHELAAKDLIPVLSWLSLSGKCRYCSKPISGQYPLVELAGVLLFVSSYAYWPYVLQPAVHSIWPGLQFGLWIITLIGFLALVVYDFRWYMLPNRIVYPLFVPAVLFAAVSIGLNHNQSIETGLFNVLGAVMIGGGVFYLLYQLSKGKWIGGGDVRLGWLLGLLVLTPERAVLLLFLASLTGTLVSLPLMALSKLKRNSVIPFGPFLIFAVIIVVLFGANILDWYDRIFLF